VVNPLGVPIDGKGDIKGKCVLSPLERIAPSVTARQPVTTSLATGIKAIDALVPIGRGQRELIIGDRGIGKTTIALDTIVNQKHEDVICIYVAIGQKTSRIAQVIEKLEQTDSLGHTIVVSASASDPASLQYLAPYSGVTLGEYFMSRGKDVLVVYDDLTKHAWSYRQVSLLLKRPSGREAYPGDIFYLHSRLLERACRLNSDHGGGSITALPIIETQAGDISAYIPTNVISITDGQIFLEPDLFYSGIRPAISVGLSVSRVGGNAQKPITKQVAGRLRLDLAQYRELAAFAQFSSDLDEATKSQIEQGKRSTEILKQSQGHPLSLSDQVISLWSAANNMLNDIAVDKITEFESQLLEYAHKHGKSLISELSKGQKLTSETESQLRHLVTSFKKQWLS
jgi:F-type H+-transporting ATPase subunit alpha